MKSRDIIIRALERSKRKRGLRIISPSNYLRDAHINKADHNLIVMTDLYDLGHEDWVVITAYYAMYQSALSLLAKIGMESKEHTTTVAVLDYFFKERISKKLIDKFNDMREKKDKIKAIIIQDKYIEYMWKAKRARETVQYGVSISYHETDEIIRNTREFVKKMKIVTSELDDNLVGEIDKLRDDLVEIAEGYQGQFF